MTYSLTWLADVPRAAGLHVSEVDGWQSRGHGDMGVVDGIICHHTGGAMIGNAPSLNLVIHGRPDLSGPLSNYVLGRDGTVYVVAAGKCNHAGPGDWHGIKSGNSDFIGIEAENAGTGADPWPEVQLDAYARLCAAILVHSHLKAEACIGHKEWALPKGRKIDPTFDMAAFRLRVAQHMGAKPSAPAPVVPVIVHDVHPHAAMLQRGDKGDDVKLLQTKLGITVDGDFGPATETAVRAFQTARALTADGLVGPKTWTALGI